jgi:membrane-anchored mycosin MYCP
MRVVRAITIAAGLSLGVPLAVVGPSVRGYAAPACAVPAASTIVAAEAPWAQRRFGLGRLAGVADGAGVIIAVLDSGVDVANPQLNGAVSAGLDLLDPGGDGRLDCVGHGTAVASIIAARQRDGRGLIGVAPAATILPIRVSERTDTDGTGRTAPTAAVAAALRTAVDRGARVINLSLTTDHDDPALREAVRQAAARDVVIVAAAGNRRESGNPRTYPAAYDGVIGVGAIAADGTAIAQSQAGDYVDLVAPGADILAAARGGGYATYAGTSFAAAFVSGAAALVRQYYPRLSAADVARRLTATADPVANWNPAAQAGPGPTDSAARSGPAQPGPTQPGPGPTPDSPYGAGVVNPFRAVTGLIPTSARPGAGPVPSPPLNAATAAEKRSTAATNRRARTLAAGAAAVALVVLILGSVLPRGTRRRWRITAGVRTG